MFLLILSFCASQKVIQTEERVDVHALIDSLSQGFSFVLRMENRAVKTDARGIYRGHGDFDIRGSITTPEGKTDVEKFDPYEQLKVVCGENRFIFRERKGNELIYEFPAVLFFLDPVRGLGKGYVYIQNGKIVRIYAETENAKWDMRIEEYRKPFIRIEVVYEGDVMNTLKQRLILFGERDVRVDGDQIVFREVVPLDTTLFIKGKVTWKLLRVCRDGSLVDPVDTLYRYCEKKEYVPGVRSIKTGTDPKGRPSLILDVENTDEGIAGLFLDGKLVGTGYANNPLILVFRDKKMPLLLSIILKTGALDGEVKKIRRL